MQDEIKAYVQNNMWSPEYAKVVYKKDWTSIWTWELLS